MIINAIQLMVVAKKKHKILVKRLKKMQIQMKVTMIITLMEMTAIRMKPKMKNQKIIDEKEKTLFGL